MPLLFQKQVFSHVQLGDLIGEAACGCATGGGANSFCGGEDNGKTGAGGTGDAG